MPLPYITAIGGLLVDIKTWPEALLLPHDSNPGKIEIFPGGVARNIAENLARLEVPCYLLGTVGRDDFGKTLIDETRKTGVQVDHIAQLAGKPTGLCVSVFDEKGELNIGMADLSTIAETSVAYLKETESIWRHSHLIVADTNLPIPTLQYLIQQANQGGIPTLIDPVSIQLAPRLLQLKGVIDFLTPNQAEYEVIRELAKGLAVKHWLVSNGEKGLSHISYETSQTYHYPAHPTRVVDVNGAGDAFIAGFIYGNYHGQSHDIAVHYGLAAAALCLQSPHSVAHTLTPEELKAFSTGKGQAE